MTDIRKKSQKQEARTAKDFGGRTQLASGALDGMKGDVRTTEFLIENKYTDKDSYKLELRTWRKIENEAIRDSVRVPLMQIDIQDLELVVLDLEDLREYISHLCTTDIRYHPTPHKSFSIGKKFIKSYILLDQVYVVGFGAKQLAIVGKDFFFNVTNKLV